MNRRAFLRTLSGSLLAAPLAAYSPAGIILATVGIIPAPMTRVGLALWCGSTLVP